ncbi:MAG: TIGR01212 family radical SAM protein [Proteobacteria bacterium]|nr:MAG: TIGR01212 family radical SAM protein [Pseudomonadota bacterium]
MSQPSPYFTYSDSLIRRYGAKTYKITLSGGQTCPTRDGTFGPKKGWGGCSFCDVHGSASYFANLRKELPVRMQMEASAGAITKRFKAEKFVAYFQSYTTTHEEIEEFKARYDEAVKFPGVVRLAVGTRPDCLPQEILELLGTYLDRVDVQLELGVQSLNDTVLDWFDRGHDAAAAIEALERALAYSAELKQKYTTHELDVSAHLIIGAPMETDADLIHTARELSRIGVHGVKIHHLHVLKKTKLERRFKNNEFPLLSMEEYFRMIAVFLRHLDPKIVVHRTHGLAPHPEELVGPDWSLQKIHPVEEFKKWMNLNGWRQGDLFQPS